MLTIYAKLKTQLNEDVDLLNLSSYLSRYQRMIDHGMQLCTKVKQIQGTFSWGKNGSHKLWSEFPVNNFSVMLRFWTYNTNYLKNFSCRCEDKNDMYILK